MDFLFLLLDFFMKEDELLVERKYFSVKGGYLGVLLLNLVFLLLNQASF